MIIKLINSNITTSGVSNTISQTLNFDCTGADFLLAASAYKEVTSTAVSTFTYAAANLTQVPSSAFNLGLSRISHYYKIAPATGSNNIVLTLTVSATSVWIGASCWSGVHQTTPLGTASGGSSNSVSVTAGIDDVSVATVMKEYIAGGGGLGPQDEQMWTNRDTSSGAQCAGGYQIGTGTVTVNWTTGDIITGVPIKPAAVPVAPHIQTIDAVGDNVASKTTQPITTTTGSLLVMNVGAYTAGLFSSVSDSEGNTWTLRSGPVDTGGGSPHMESRQYENNNGTRGANHTFTFTLTGADYPNIVVNEFSGQNTTSAFDKQATGANTGAASLTTGSTAALAQADEIIVAFFTNVVGPVTDITGYTLTAARDTASGDGHIAGYKVVSATTAVNATANVVTSASQEMTGVLGTYKIAVGGASAVPVIVNQYRKRRG